MRPVAGGVLSRIALAGCATAVFAGSVVDLGHSPIADVNDKMQHIAAFIVLGCLSRFACPGLTPWRRILPLLTGYGLLIECVQWWLPWREFSLPDLVADILGIVVALAAMRSVPLKPPGRGS